MKTTIIPDLVINALQSAIITDHGVQLQGQLDRKDYVTVNKVLEACGCKWNRKLKLHEFQGEDSRRKISAALDSGSYTHEKKAYDFFETPEWVANEMADLLSLKDGERVLEPSAGNGRLVEAVKRKYPSALITAVELNPECVSLIRDVDGIAHIIEADFTNCVVGTAKNSYHAVVMNPPFSNSQDVKHILHAMQFLKRGGRLVAITSPGYTFREGKIYDAFRRMLDTNKLIIEKELPSGTFKASGTMVRTMMLVIEKK